MDMYDYIITGTGASGLILAYRMINDSFFDDKRILLIDKEKKNSNDRTWCYWEKGEGEWDYMLSKSWGEVLFRGDLYSKCLSIGPYSYKMVRSSKLYENILKELENQDHITLVQDEILNISDKSRSVSVLTKKSEYYGKRVLNSILFHHDFRQQIRYPVLKQHFLGWFIETKQDAFDDSTATFMDFTVEQRGNTRFMYVLPVSKKVALFEYTLFSEKLLDNEEYEAEIELYLKKQGIKEYKIIEKEQGIIPMTSFKFWKRNSKNILNIGTAGGWTKASTGYTFMNISKKTKDLVEFLKTERSLKEFQKKTRFWYYDLLLLDVLHKDNSIGAMIFGTLFKRNSVQSIFKFLDEKSSFMEDLRIIITMPQLRFLRALWGRLFS